MAYDEVARSDSGRGELVLGRRAGPGGDVLELRANGVFVMDTTETTSERELARRSLALVARPGRVLVGGLGLGFTLAEALADSRVERVTVVEIEPGLVGWLRDGTVPHGPGLLADPRVEVVVADVAQAVQDADEASLDVVLLDVDNGPGYLVHDVNARLYTTAWLRSVRRALAPGGVCVVWSMDRSDDLDHALTEVFGAAEAVPCDVDLQDRAEHYWLHLAFRQPG